MGFSYKTEKLCIFIPIHLSNNQIFDIDDEIEVIIIGKRIEENIVCIAKPA